VLRWLLPFLLLHLSLILNGFCCDQWLILHGISLAPLLFPVWFLSLHRPSALLCRSQQLLNSFCCDQWLQYCMEFPTPLSFSLYNFCLCIDLLPFFVGFANLSRLLSLMPSLQSDVGCDRLSQSTHLATLHLNKWMDHL